MIKIKCEGVVDDIFFGGMDRKIKQMDDELRRLRNSTKEIIPDITGVSLIPLTLRTYYPKSVKDGWLKGAVGQNLNELYYMADGNFHTMDVTFQTKKKRKFAAEKMSIVPILGIRTAEDFSGASFEFGGYTFKIISQKIAVCTESIGESAFADENKDNEHIYYYPESTAKQFIDDWFKKAHSDYVVSAKKKRKQQELKKQQQEEEERQKKKLQSYKEILIQRIDDLKLLGFEKKELLKAMDSEFYDSCTEEEINMHSGEYIRELILDADDFKSLNLLSNYLDDLEQNRRSRNQAKTEPVKKKRMKSNRCPNCGAIFLKQDWLNDEDTIDCPSCGDWFYKEDLMEFYKRNNKGKQYYE